jgi:hypothetical protein
MHFTSLVYILNFSGKNTVRKDFLHPGCFDPRSLSDGARGSTRPAMLDQVNLVSGLVGASSARRAKRARGRLGRGPTGPETHQKCSGEIGLAGRGPAARNLRRRSSVYCGGNGDSDGDSGRGASIP